MPHALSILYYGRLVTQPDPLFPDATDGRRLDLQLRLLRRWFRVLPLAAAVALLREHALPARSVCITFDGGLAEHAMIALPALQRLGLPATFFISSGLLDGGDCWRNAVVELVRSAPGKRLALARGGFGNFDIGCVLRRRAVIDTLVAALAAMPQGERQARVRAMTRAPGRPGLSADQVLALHRAGMGVGAHTVSGSRVSSLSNAQARAEIAAGRARLEQIVQAPVQLFSYPDGRPGRDFEQRHGNMLRAAGFQAAVSTMPGAARAGCDAFALPRLAPCSLGKLRFAGQLAVGLLNSALSPSLSA